MKTLPCPRCAGTGIIPDPRAIGAEMRELREKAGLSLREVARRMDLTAPYISDLELGRRGWTKDRESQYRKALKQ